MDSWFTRILQFLGKDNISFYENILFKRGFKVFLIQACGLVFAFSANILLARLYGGQVYGIYSLVSSWCVLLAVLSLFGMDDSHLVQLPTWKLEGRIKKIRRQLRWSLSINSISLPVVCTVFLFILHYFDLPGISKYRYYFNYGLLLVILLTVMNNLVSFLRGMDKVIYGEIIEKIARPLFLIIFLLVFYYAGKPDLAADSILAASAGLFSSILLLAFKIRKTIGEVKGAGIGPKGSHSSKSNFQYVLLNLMYFLSTRMDLLLLGLFSSVASVGHYNVALKFADIASYPVAIINLSLPTLVSTVKHEIGQEAGPQLLYRISKNSFYQCLLLCCLFLLTGPRILQWYGKEFGDAFSILVVFLASNLLSAFIGSADVFFILEGREKKPIYCRIYSLIFTFILAVFLIPKLSMMGAAVSMFVGNLIYCGIMEYYFFKQYGIFIHPFASKNKYKSVQKKNK